MFKSGFVAIIGQPNVGKSTLLNSIIDSKISIVSPRPQTTRDKILGILNEPDQQVIFIDTPGIIRPNSKLDEYMKKNIKDALKGVDVIVYVLDVKSKIDNKEIEMIENYSKSVNGNLILLVNKVDLINSKDIYEKLSLFKDMKNISDIIPTSAKKGFNTKVLKTAISKLLPEGPKYYDDSDFTDVNEKFLVSEIIREKALLFIRDEIPHGVAVKIEKFLEKEDIVEIDALIICSKPSHKNIIIGRRGSMLKNIGKSARLDIERLLDKKVYLNTWVKVEKDWKDSLGKLKDFGYM